MSPSGQEPDRPCARGLADAGLKAKFAELGHQPMPMTPTEFGKFIAAETKKWGPVVKAVVKAVGIKPQ
jgi:tripartite-type tricarboxylate transporter receptor subunit TctC